VYAGSIPADASKNNNDLSHRGGFGAIQALRKTAIAFGAHEVIANRACD
jgi:hypothetical protein